MAAWSRDTLPLLPEAWPLVVIEEGREQFGVLKRILTSPHVSVVCATDAGREGELIFRYIYEAAGSTLPFDRLCRWAGCRRRRSRSPSSSSCRSAASSPRTTSGGGDVRAARRRQLPRRLVSAATLPAVVSAIGGRYAGLLAPLTPSRPLGSRTVDALDDKKLSRAMRDSGLGTPATRAETIETLIRHGYLAREGRSLAATDKGVRLIGVVHPHVKSPAMTGEWEAFL